MPNSTKSYRFALTGYPLGHSLSPRIHSAALAANGLSGEYSLRPIEPEQKTLGLRNLIEELRDRKLDGLNVTIPYKQDIFTLCDEFSQTARAVGAVNLLYRRDDGRIFGDNSDVPGFIAGLAQVEPKTASSPSRAVVLGAGGSARAVVYALASNSWRVSILARRPEQAAELANSFAGIVPERSIDTGSFDEERLTDLSADLIVNTTPIGMSPDICCSPWPAQIPLPTGAIIYDLVYNPRNTVLLDQARAQGLGVIGGIHMLVEQAAISFERWTGFAAPRQEMLNAVRN